MASKKTLNAENLARLGAKQLADLLIEVSAGNAAMKRRLRLELVSEQGPREIALEVRKRLRALEKSRSFVEWHSIKGLVTDLETQLKMIVEKVASEEPDEAFELIWEFLETAPSIYERCDDSSGRIGDVFCKAMDQLSEVSSKARLDSVALAHRVFDAIKPDSNGYGEFDDLVSAVSRALGKKGFKVLKQLALDYQKEAVANEPAREDEIIHIHSRYHSFALDKDYLVERRDRFVRMLLEDIADQQGDVDAYIAQQSDDMLKVPGIATEIATRLLAANRANEALRYLDAAQSRHGPIASAHPGWTMARIQTLDALDRKQEVQDFLWATFKETLESKYLRDLTKRLPDFEDFEREREAFVWAASSPDVHMALHFFIEWPALKQASTLVIDRYRELDGNNYSILTPAADALQDGYPLSASLIRRSMIDFSLDKARASRYKHAARHFQECQNAYVPDFGSFQSHDEYAKQLRAKHGRKTSFWAELG